MVGDDRGGRVFDSGSEPLPPAVTQRNHQGATTPDLVLAPPFVPGTSTTAPAAGAPPQPSNAITAAFDSPEQETIPVDALAPTEDSEPAADEPAQDEPLLELTDPFAGDPDALPTGLPWEPPSLEPMPWESAPASPDWPSAVGAEEFEGLVEPAFGDDANVTSDAILAGNTEDEFPIDAFIIPEHARRVPTGLPDPDFAHHGDPTHELAERFEKLSRRLRAEDIESLLPSLARGDRFDALVAGFIAGYFSARDL